MTTPNLPESRADLLAMLTGQLAEVKASAETLTGFYLLGLVDAKRPNECPLHWDNGRGEIKWTPYPQAKRYTSRENAEHNLRAFARSKSPEGYSLAVIAIEEVVARHVADLEGLIASWGEA